MLGQRHPPAECPDARNIIVHANGLGCNARQLISVCRGGFGQGGAPTFPKAVQGLPSKDPDQFTDGGVTNPNNQLWSIGGFGVWTKQYDDNSTTPTLFHERYVDEGTSRCGPMAGFRTSSTRNELAGGILALLVPSPVHIASDSRGFFEKANYLIGAAELWILSYGTEIHSCRNPCGRVWGLQVDGVLWEIFW